MWYMLLKGTAALRRFCCFRQWTARTQSVWFRRLRISIMRRSSASDMKSNQSLTNSVRLWVVRKGTMFGHFLWISDILAIFGPTVTVFKVWSNKVVVFIANGRDTMVNFLECTGSLQKIAEISLKEAGILHLFRLYSARTSYLAVLSKPQCSFMSYRFQWQGVSRPRMVWSPWMTQFPLFASLIKTMTSQRISSFIRWNCD